MAYLRRIEDEETFNLNDLIDDFMLFKQGQGRADKTLKDYRWHIAYFFKSYPDAWPNNLKQTVLSYMAKPAAPATFNLKLAYLKNFFDFLLEQGAIESNPLTGIKKKYDGGKVRSIDEETLTRLLRLPNQKTFAGLRDYCLLILTLETGIRPGEALKLTASDLDLANNMVTVQAGVSKTRRIRYIPISQATVKAIKKLINARHPAWPDNGTIFCNFEGKKLNVNGWYQRIKIYSKKLGIKIRPYDLRHAFSLLYLQNGGNAFSLMHTLGHTNTTMTKRYVNYTNQDLAEVLKVASPLNKLLQQAKRVKKL